MEAYTSSVFEVLREQLSPSEILGTEIGKEAFCLFHDDKGRPNMRLYPSHAYCFSCGAYADVVSVWAKKRGIESQLEAAFDLAREFGIQTPNMSAESKQKAEEKRAREETLLEEARKMHDSAERIEAVREWWGGRGFAEELRKRFLLGAADAQTASIPFWHRGRVVGIIRRPLGGDRKYILPAKEDFPEGHKPLFVPSANSWASSSAEMFLVEGYLDALAVAATGRSVAAVGSTHLSDHQASQIRRLLRSSPSGSKLYVLPDDDAGRAAARDWGKGFYPRTMICSASGYGGERSLEGNKDIADLLASDGVVKTGDQLDRLQAAAKDPCDIEAQILAEEPGGPREKLAYAMEHIVPLLVMIESETLADATADMVVDLVGKGKLKKSWLTKGMKEAREERMGEIMRDARERAEERAKQLREEFAIKVERAQPEIDELISRPGVLERLRKTAAAMHGIEGDEKPLELALLVALGAQLEPLPNGRPLGASILLTAPPGRGKNHVCDGAVRPLPEHFYFAFEIASGQSLYYKADEDPDFLRHVFCYPNEIEGAESLWEFLRPMLSKGKATKIVTAKDPDGNMTTRMIIVEGPVTIAIPTIRNKTDEQLQTRLLVAELSDFEGRVKQHSAAVSEQLRPAAYSAEEYSYLRWLWQVGLTQLTANRKVVFPLSHPNFALDDDQLSHGARTWANLLGLMSAHAWLEQTHRSIVDLPEGRTAIVATPDDYAVAYDIFTAVCKRTILNISDTHRKILNGMLSLQENNPQRYGFTQREIAQAASVSLSTVSSNKTFLVTSAKLLWESEDGLELVRDANPTWWETGDLTKGLPTPEQVAKWWIAATPEGSHFPSGGLSEDSPKSAEHTEHAEQGDEQGSEADRYADSSVRHPTEYPTEQEPNDTEGVRGRRNRSNVFGRRSASSRTPRLA
jgi:hypothetical protein